MWGRCLLRDGTVSRAAIETLRRGIPHAKFALIADSGHATPIDQAETFDRVMEEFLESVPAPGAADLRVGAK